MFVLFYITLTYYTSSEKDDFFKTLKLSHFEVAPNLLDGYLACAGEDMGVLKTPQPLLKMS